MSAPIITLAYARYVSECQHEPRLAQQPTTKYESYRAEFRARKERRLLLSELWTVRFNQRGHATA